MLGYKRKELPRINMHQSVKVNEDIWFYNNPKTITFVVWTQDKGHGRYAIHFTVKKSKLI